MNTFIIFGAGSAIAQATAKQALSSYQKFILIDQNEQRLQTVENDLTARGATSVETITANLADTTTHKELIKKINPGNDTAILFAYGILSKQKNIQSTWESTYNELNINFISVASLLTHLATHLETIKNLHNNTIAVISSVAGDRGRMSNYIYGTAKGALSLFTAGLRARLAPQGIHVITVKPGFVDTPMTADFKKGLLWAKPDTIARGILNAIKNKKNIVYLPWFWRYVMLILSAIPESIFKKMNI